MTGIEGYHRYMEAVTSGKEVCCLPVKQAIERQTKDLERQNSSDFPYYFCEETADKYLTFIGLLKCTSGEWKGKPFVLSDFQAWRLAVVFGWLGKETHTRRFRRAYIEVARKNGKTEEGAAVSVCGLVLDGEETAQVFSAATTRQQAKIVFSAAKIMCRYLAKDSPYIRKRLKAMTQRVVDTETDSYVEALSSDAWTLDGLSPHLAVVDEYHAHPTNEVLKVLETGMGARQQPLMYIITTAGYNLEGPCYGLRQVALNILSGALTDETFFAIVYTLDEGDDPYDETVWKKANPNIGITPKWDFMRSEAQKAQNEGKTAERDFLTKNLNVWVRSSTGWIRDDVWVQCPSEINFQRLKGRICYGGIDLASTSDFSALALFFPGTEDEPHEMLWWLWVPESAFEARMKAVPSMLDWRHHKWIEVTPGNVMDYDYIEARVNEINAMYQVKVIGCDPHNAQQLMVKLADLGIPVNPFSQGIMHMSSPTKEFERLVNRGDLNHGGNPVLRWMIGNVHLYRDANDNIKVHKGRSTEKVDGVVAGIIAVGEWMTQPVPQVSYLESNDLLTF